LVLAGIPCQKKVDAAKHLLVPDHVDLRFNKPPGKRRAAFYFVFRQ
jgi:hypothetical protein